MSSDSNITSAESNGVTDTTDSERSKSSVIDPPIDGTLVATIITSMRLDTQATVNKCARDAWRIKDSINNNTLTPTKLEAIMVALGFSSDCAGAELSEPAKQAKVARWIKSITDLASTECTGDLHLDASLSDSGGASVDGSSVATVPYRFPYGSVNANEVKAMLLSCAGSVAVTTGNIPGPFSNTTLVHQRRAVLKWLDENPEHLQTHRGSNQTDEDTSLRDAIISSTVSKAFLGPLEGKEKAIAKLGHQNEPNYTKQYYKDNNNGRVPGVELCDIMQCGLAMKQGSPFIRDSTDAIALERQEAPDEEMEDFDYISSRLVECKCRAGAGANGSLRTAGSKEKLWIDV